MYVTLQEVRFCYHLIAILSPYDNGQSPDISGQFKYLTGQTKWLVRFSIHYQWKSHSFYNTNVRTILSPYHIVLLH